MTDEKPSDPSRMESKDQSSKPARNTIEGCEPDMKLANFMAKLAAEPTFRARFAEDDEQLMRDAQLSEPAKKAIREHKQNDLLRLICISQQNT